MIDIYVRLGHAGREAALGRTPLVKAAVVFHILVFLPPHLVLG
jgi:hypothetical protein